MSDPDESYFLKNLSFQKQRDLLIHWYYFITENKLWKYLISITFKKEDEETLYKNVEKKSRIEFSNMSVRFKTLMEEAKKDDLSDLELLHVIMFMKMVHGKGYSEYDFPILVKSDEVTFNPIFMV